MIDTPKSHHTPENTTSSADMIRRTQAVSAPNYDPLPVVIHRGEGSWVWDVEGNKYLDCLSAYSAVSHGHCHPRILKALIDQAQRVALPSRAFYNDQMPPFLEKLTQLTGLEMALPMNTGAEAVETAIKVARKWGYLVKGVPQDKAEIIVCENNFHGRTTTIISFSSEESYKEGFGPLTPGFKIVPYNDAAAVEAAITPNTVACLLEPIQGEGGIIVPDDAYLPTVQEICRRHNVLFFCDEIQTGLGRTGAMFCFQHTCATPPDGLMLGKALGGGVYPVSAFLANSSLLNLMGPGTHGSTFGGNPLASAVGLEALEILLDEDLTSKAKDMGRYLMQGLRTIKSPNIKEVRGRGLLIGIEVQGNLTARDCVKKLAKKGILAKDTHETVIRLAPPLSLTHREADLIIAALKEIFDAH